MARETSRRLINRLVWTTLLAVAGTQRVELKAVTLDGASVWHPLGWHPKRSTTNTMSHLRIGPTPLNHMHQDAVGTSADAFDSELFGKCADMFRKTFLTNQINRAKAMAQRVD